MKEEEEEENSYQKQRKKSHEFEKRSDYLEHELSIMNPKRWGVNLPFRDYNFEIEDVMVSAMVGAWASSSSLGLDQAFVIENTRWEMIIVGLLFAFFFSGFLNPNANLAGTHGPMVAVIPFIVASGGHPLALGLTVGVFGLALSLCKGGSKLITLTGNGVRGGLLIYLGLTGALKYIGKMETWSMGNGVPLLYVVLIFTTILVYAILARMKKRWLAIPLCSALALIISFALGAPFSF